MDQQNETNWVCRVVNKEYVKRLPPSQREGTVSAATEEEARRAAAEELMLRYSDEPPAVPTIVLAPEDIECMPQEDCWSGKPWPSEKMGSAE